MGLYLRFLIAAAFLAGAIVGARAQTPVAVCVPASTGTSCIPTLNPVGMSNAIAASSTLKASGGTLVGFQANNTNTSSRWVLLFDANAVPSDGTVTGCATTASTRPCLAKAYQIGASSTIGVSWSPGPFPLFTTGIILVCSTTGPFTKTATSDCVFSGEAN